MISTNKIYTTIVIAVFTVLLSFQSYSQNWDIPANKSSKNSYIPFNNETAKAGEAIYTKNCQSCHGNPGKANSLKTLKPVPPDLSEKQTQSRTDGDLFYIITTGRVVMPSFKIVLSEEERWKVIAFIRSYNKSYVQVLSKTDPSKSKLVKIVLDFNAKNNKIRVYAKANEASGVVLLKDAEIMLFANRYFGKLQIDKTLTTNSEGYADFNFPKDLPGDKTGNIDIVVNVNDELYGEIEHQEKLNIGIPTDKPALNEQRAIWNTLLKAPIWIIVTYTSLILLVTLVLLYILNTLRKLKKIGDK
ncbi:MAG: cytochrome c [Bacteroidetes bacterium]|nr:cytochrome c [Bacteroidota bacterium]